MDAGYKYDAFISYRHTKNDTIIAETLHKKLETYHIPRYLVRSHYRSRIKRVFRDRDELPTSGNLGDNIINALKSSEFLIVICSPQTPHSQWVATEITEFQKYHSSDNILALLIEGEPVTSFPEPLFYKKSSSINDKGESQTLLLPVEPLAADIRAISIRKMKKNLKREKLRLIAAIIGCDYDQLRRRHRQRTKKKILIFSLCLFILLALISIISLNQWKNYQEQKKAARINQSLYLSGLSRNLTNGGNILEGIQTALDALPQSDKDPYVVQSESSLYHAITNFHKPALLGDHKGLITSICFSDNDVYAAFTSEDYTTSVWNINTGELIATLAHGHTDAVKYADFNSINTRLVTTSNDGTAVIWDLQTGNVIKSLPWKNSPAIFSSNNENLIDIEDASAKKYQDLEILKTLTSEISKIDLNYTTNRIALITNSGQLQFYTLDTLEPVNFIEDGCYYWHILISPDGRYALASDDSGAVRLFDTESGTQKYFVTQTDALAGFNFSNDSSIIAIGTGSQDSHSNRVLLIKTEASEPYRSKISYPNVVTGWFDLEHMFCLVSATGECLKESAKDQTLSSKASPLKGITADTVLAVDKSWHKFITRDKEGFVYITDLDSNILHRKLTFEPYQIAYATYSNDGKHLALCLWDNSIRLLDTITYHEISKLSGHQSPPHYASFSSDNKLLVTGSEDGTVKIWNLDDGHLIQSLNCGGYVLCVKFSTDMHKLIAASNDITIENCKVMIWDLENITGTDVIQSDSVGFTAVAFTGDGVRFAAAGYEHQITVCDTKTFTELYKIEVEDDVKDLTFSEDGAYLLVFFENNTAELYQLYTDYRTLKEYAVTLVQN